MDYRVLLKEENEAVRERFTLASERIREIIAGEKTEIAEELRLYFHRTARFLEECRALYEDVASGALNHCTLEELQAENKRFYADILPENYAVSYANPAYAVKVLGEEYGRVLSFLYTELRGERVYIF